MPVYERNKLNSLFQEIEKGNLFPAYLFIGERYLCQQAADQVAKLLCAAGGTVHSIDGDSENSDHTLSKLRSFSLLGGRQVFRVNNSKLFHSKNVAQGIWKRAVQAHKSNKPEKALKYLQAMMEAGGLNSGDSENAPGALSAAQWKKCFGFAKPDGQLDWTGELLTRYSDQSEKEAKSGQSSRNAGETLLAALDAGIPENNILLLLAEEVDKRKKLYKAFKEQQAVIDLQVDSGTGAQAKKVQQAVLQEQVHAVLKKMKKTKKSGKKKK